MLSIEIKVNGKLVKWLGVRNIHPDGITKINKYKQHPYCVYEHNGNKLGFVTHQREDGILHLVDSVMTMIGQKLWLMDDDEAKELGDPV